MTLFSTQILPSGRMIDQMPCQGMDRFNIVELSDRLDRLKALKQRHAQVSGVHEAKGLKAASEQLGETFENGFDKLNKTCDDLGKLNYSLTENIQNLISTYESQKNKKK